jgi:heterotetrameric sarcosine oxidase delta subunit
MSFLLPCPECGPRDVYEFRWGGERTERPPADASHETWMQYLYARANVAGVQEEWWYHRMGCRRWFLAVRDTRTNDVERVAWPGPAGLAGDGDPDAGGRRTRADDASRPDAPTG